MLQKGKGDRREERMVMQPTPGPALVVVEPQLFLQLLMALLTDPARLEPPDQRAARGCRRQIRQVVPALAVRAVSAARTAALVP